MPRLLRSVAVDGQRMLGMLDLGLDVILIIMYALHVRDLSCQMRTRKLFYKTGVPVIINKDYIHTYERAFLGFLLFLLVDPAFRVRRLRRLVISTRATISYFSGDCIASPAATSMLQLLPRIMIQAINLEKLEVDRCHWFFASAQLVNAVADSCRSMTELDISSSEPSVWDKGRALIERLRCPLRSLHIDIPISPGDPEVEHSVSLDMLLQFKDTLEELQVFGTRLITEAQDDERRVWPRVRFLWLDINIQNHALLPQFFPNVRYLIISPISHFKLGKGPGDQTMSWGNLDAVKIPPVLVAYAPRCKIRLLLTSLYLFGVPNDVIQTLLRISNPSVLDLRLNSNVSSDSLREALVAAPRLRCLRLITTAAGKDSACLPLVVGFS
jgi:hypothetical protein